MQKTLVIKTDGGARGNPGPSATGIYIFDPLQNKHIAGFGTYLGIATNNEAEYHAVEEALSWVIKNEASIIKNYSSIKLVSDSLLLVNQLNGNYKVKSMNLRPLFFKVKVWESKLKLPICYNHVKRELNKEPDKILNNILDSNITG